MSYVRMLIGPEARLIYLHRIEPGDIIGCQITDNSRIRGVSFAPEDLDSLHSDTLDSP